MKTESTAQAKLYIGIDIHMPRLQAELATEKIGSIKTEQPLLHRRCPVCKKGRLHTILLFNDRGPPANWSALLEDKKLIMSN